MSTEGDIRGFLASDQSDVFFLRLKDRLADLGLVAVAIVRYDGESAEIDTFLMSCRVLGRGAEDLLLAHLLNAARGRGVRRATGTFLPTAKNQQVKDFYPRQGFVLVREGQWSIELTAPRPYPDWIQRSKP